MERIRVLDVLRGIAILGILLANIEAFGRAQIAHEIDPSLAVLSEAEWILEGLRTWLVSGKFRSLLAILFGIGLWMQYETLMATGEWPNKYAKRTLFLFFIGVIHLLLLWFGDILTIYAVTALIAMMMVKVNEKALWAIICTLGGFSLLLGIIFSIVGSGSEGALEQLGKFGLWLSYEKETYVFAEGPWGMQFLYRLGMAITAAFNGFFALLDILPLFLFGIILGRRKYLTQPEESPGILKWGIVIGLIGLLSNSLQLVWTLLGHQRDISVMIELGFGAFLSVGILVLITTLYSKIKIKWIWRPFELVGRTALSCYLMQSVICTFVFYSFGLGYFGKFNRFEILSVVPLVWLANILFAAFWLQFFTMGPVEYVWRSWVDGKWRGLLRTRA